MTIVKLDVCCGLRCVMGGSEIRGVELDRIGGLIAGHQRSRGWTVSLQRFRGHSIELG